MSKYCVMSLMMRHEVAEEEVDPFALSAQMADLLDRISYKLTDEELAFFIKAGGKIYHDGVKEFGAGLPLEDMFPAVENLDPHAGRGGFRKDAYRR